MIYVMLKTKTIEDFTPPKVQDLRIVSLRRRFLLLVDITHKLSCIIQLFPNFAILNTLV